MPPRSHLIFLIHVSPDRIYDDMPHDLVLFSVASSANYAYRAIASFCKAVTLRDDERHENSLDSINETMPNAIADRMEQMQNPEAAAFRHGRVLPPPSHHKMTQSESEALQETIYSPWYSFHVCLNYVFPAHYKRAQTDSFSQRPDYINNMIRERVGIDGKVRPLEREEDVQACCMHPDDVGLIKECANHILQSRQSG